MKIKVKGGRKGVGFLLCTSKVGEELRYKEAEVVRIGQSEVFLPLEYESKGKGYAFSYPLNSVEAISERLKRPLASGHFEGILQSFLDVARACNRHELSMQRILFQPEFSFFDSAAFALRFAYVPLQAKMETGSPFELIAYIAQNATFHDNAADELAKKALDYSLGNTVFELVGYEGFLRRLGVVGGEGRMSQPGRPGRDTEPVDCRGEFGYDFVAERISGRLEAAAGGASRVLAGHAASPASSVAGAGVGATSAAAVGSMPGASSVSGVPSCVAAATIAGAASVGICEATFTLISVSSGRSWTLSSGSYYLGCSSDCQIKVADRGVSRQHARLLVNAGHCFIEDLSSTNGTAIDGSRLKPGELVEAHPGQVLHLAKARLKLSQG